MKPYVHAVRPPQADEASILGVWHRAPAFQVPAGACDCHVHIFGPRDRYPLAEDRTFAPALAGVSDLLAMHDRIGIDRVVLVQASPQGFDNACVLDALRECRAQGHDARAVVVVPADTPRSTLQRLTEQGARGLRVNLHSYGHTDPEVAADRLLRTADMASAADMHLQIYTSLGMLAELVDTIARLPVPLVVDHFGLADPALGLGQRGLPEVLHLIAAGQVYIKLSAPYRIVGRVDGTDATPLARAFIDANPARMLWGTDWPHTGPWPGKPRDRDGAEPFHPIDDGAQLDMLAGWTTPAERQLILVDNAARLYGF